MIGHWVILINPKLEEIRALILKGPDENINKTISLLDKICHNILDSNMVNKA